MMIINPYQFNTLFSGSGGIETLPGNGYKYHTFNSSGTLTVIQPGEVEYLVVGGGGGGSGGVNSVNYGSGGGSGTVRTGTISIAANQTITIGAGGAGSLTTGGNGGSSSIGSLVTATGGNGATTSRTGGSNADFAGQTNSGAFSSGAGAGAAENGGTDGNALGGDGVQWPASSGSYYGGGGGGVNTSNVAQAGGDGGGGSASTSLTGGAGTANTGGGGGGGTASTGGGAGGSGVVRIRYLTGADSGGVDMLYSKHEWDFSNPSVVLSGSDIMSVPDSIGGITATATGGSSATRLQVSNLNGVTCAQSLNTPADEVGTARWVEAPVVSKSQPLTIWGVFQLAALDHSLYTLIASIGAATGYSYVGSGTFGQRRWIGASGSSIQSNNGVATTDTHFIWYEANGASSRLFVDNVFIVGGDAGTAGIQSTTGILIGANNRYNYSWHGKIGMVGMGYGGIESDSVRTAKYNAAKLKWGTL